MFNDKDLPYESLDDSFEDPDYCQDKELQGYSSCDSDSELELNKNTYDGKARGNNRKAKLKKKSSGDTPNKNRQTSSVAKNIDPSSTVNSVNSSSINPDVEELNIPADNFNPPNELVENVADVDGQSISSVQLINGLDSRASGFAVSTVTLDDEIRYKCERCSKNFKYFGSAINHSKACNQEYLCLKCKTSFKKLAYLKSHVKNVHSEGKWGCEKCPLKFRSICKLKGHMKIHINKPVKCSICQRTFKSKAICSSHKSKLHPTKPKLPTKKVWRCTDCPKSFKSDRGLRYHKSLHKKVAEKDDVVALEREIVIDETYPELEVSLFDIDDNTGVGEEVLVVIEE